MFSAVVEIDRNIMVIDVPINPKDSVNIEEFISKNSESILEDYVCQGC